MAHGTKLHYINDTSNTNIIWKIQTSSVSTALAAHLFKKGHGGTWSFSYYLERWYFFSKTDVFSLGRKWEMIFLKKYMEIWYFLCTRTGVTNVAPRPSGKKKQRWSYPAKIHLKVIGVLDWHSRKSSSNPLYSRAKKTSLFSKVAGLHVCNFLQKRLQGRCFPVSTLSKFQVHLFLQNTSLLF